MPVSTEFIQGSEVAKEAEEFGRSRGTTVLTVAFTDIVGSTELRERLGERAYEVMRVDHEREVEGVVSTDDAGRVVKGTGDGALIVFEQPSIAVQRMMTLQEVVAAHSYIRLRIGMDLGEITRIGGSGRVADVFGRHVNRAARIQSLTEPGHILTSFNVYDCSVGWLKDQGVEWHSHGRIPLKGFTGRFELFEPYLAGRSSPQGRIDLSVAEHETDYAAYDVSGPLASRGHGSAGGASERSVILEVDAPRIRATKLPPASSHESRDLLHYFGFRIGMSAKAYAMSQGGPPRFLWIDDFPSNNTYLIETLEKAGCQIIPRVSTMQGLEALRQERFAAVITDMGRADQADAGLDLIQRMRTANILTPTLVFASVNAVSRFGRMAKRKGAVLCTAGFVTLLDGLRQVLDWWVKRK